MKSSIRYALVSLAMLSAFSCSGSLLVDSRIVLPSGKALTSEEVDQLTALGEQQGVAELSARSLSEGGESTVDDDLGIIEAYIAALHDEFGDSATQYYGESVVEYGEPLDGSTVAARSIHPVSTTNSTVAWIDVTLKKHWGPWWVWNEVIAALVYRDPDSGSTKNFFCDKTAWAYKDAVTNKSGSFTTPLYPAGSDLSSQIQYAVAVANSGVLGNCTGIKGMTKYGFFPS